MHINATSPLQTLTVRPLSAPPQLERARSPQTRGDEPIAPSEPNALANADGDTATFSAEATNQDKETEQGGPGAPRAQNGKPLTEEQQREVQQLAKRDAQVKAHEQAHVAAAGALYRGGPNYEYKTGPDGKRYAVAGNVQIDTSPGRTPEETIAKAAQIRRAALAPADPSSTDQSVAANASQMESKARQELVEASNKNADPVSGMTGPGAESDQTQSPERLAMPVLDIYA